LADISQLAGGRPRPHPQPPERLVEGNRFGGRHYPLGLLDPDSASYFALKKWLSVDGG